MTMTHSGGIAQGTNGNRAERNSSIPMFNVARTNANEIQTSIVSCCSSSSSSSS
jgi:hypothetical protein